MIISRRKFLSAAATAASFAAFARAAQAACPFRVAVINDEISQDFDHVCSVVAKDFGLQWIELRSMWGKNVTSMPDADLERAQGILAKYNLRVTDIASPLFKTDWPGAPLSKLSEHRDQFNADFTFKQQEDLLDHSITLAKRFNTDRIRCFDFWRLDDVAPYRAAINEKLRDSARKCASNNLILLLENEMSCNTATAEEAAATLHAIPEHNFMLNWDPGNAATFPNSEAFPRGYHMLPEKRIGHCHAKSVIRKSDGKWEWAAVGAGVVDWAGQLAALKHDHYHYAVSLETHWRGGGTPEESTRISFKGLREALAKAGTGC